ncbi:MAG: hypothetical protein FJ125_07930, partial [Deltaproteobacteria bacterium]|nr:hypothetical protein [Deltaproteobacteria bacterium]
MGAAGAIGWCPASGAAPHGQASETRGDDGDFRVIMGMASVSLGRPALDGARSPASPDISLISPLTLLPGSPKEPERPVGRTPPDTTARQARSGHLTTKFRTAVLKPNMLPESDARAGMQGGDHGLDEERQQMQELFSPRSVLVVGVSDRPGNLAANIVRNLIDIGYPGEITLLGRREGNLYGHRIRTGWEEVPSGIELAAILVPAQQVVEAIERAGAHGIRWAVVETGGFSELGEEGRRIEEQLVAAAARHGIRFTGPNGLGVIDLRSRLALPFMYFPAFPQPGRIHLLAQSGGVGLYYLQRFISENLGVGSFVSMGNKLDIDECDLLEHLRTQGPGAVCLYLEDIRNGRRFFEATRNYPCPLLVQKANVSAAGAQAAASHTAAVAVDDRVLDAALRQNRLVRVREMKTMVNHAKAFTLPPMIGDRLLIVSRSGGHAVIAADLAEQYGFGTLPLDPSVERIARAGLRARVVQLRNPLDLGDVFDMEVYRLILEQGLSSPAVDGIVFIHAYAGGPEQQPSRKLIAEVARISREQGKPIYTCLLCTDDEVATLRCQLAFPIFDSPEEAMVAAAVSRDAALLRRQRAAALSAPAVLPELADVAAIEVILANARPGLLPGAAALELIAAAGIRIAPFR